MYLLSIFPLPLPQFIFFRFTERKLTQTGCECEREKDWKEIEQQIHCDTSLPQRQYSIILRSCRLEMLTLLASMTVFDIASFNSNSLKFWRQLWTLSPSFYLPVIKDIFISQLGFRCMKFMDGVGRGVPQPSLYRLPSGTPWGMFNHQTGGQTSLLQFETAGS